LKIGISTPLTPPQKWLFGFFLKKTFRDQKNYFKKKSKKPFLRRGERSTDSNFQGCRSKGVLRSASADR
jgi:hypothetical protein